MTDTPNDAAPTPKRPPLDADLIRAGEYALGLLSPIEVARFNQELLTSPALASKHADWVNTLVTLTAGRDVQPPVNLLPAIEARLFPPEPTPPKRAPWLGTFTLVMGPLVALVTAAWILQR